MVAFVDIIGLPKGAEVFVDGKSIGKIPIYYHMFKWGKYHVVAKKAGYETGERKEFIIYKTDRYKVIYFNLHKTGGL